MSNKVVEKGHCYFWHIIIKEDSQQHDTWMNQGSKPQRSVWEGRALEAENISTKMQHERDYSSHETTKRSLWLGWGEQEVKKNYKMGASGDKSCCKRAELYENKNYMLTTYSLSYVMHMQYVYYIY